MTYVDVHVADGRITIVAHNPDDLLKRVEKEMVGEKELESLCG